LQSRVDEYQARLNRAPVMEQQFADLTRDYEQSKLSYDSLLAKKNQSEMATDLERTQQGEHFRMLDPPNLPMKPFKPNRLQLCALGVVVGLVFGGGLAAGLELTAGKVYNERDIKKLMPFDVVVEIPSLDTPQEVTSIRRGNILAVVAAIMVVVCLLAGSAITYLRG